MSSIGGSASMAQRSGMAEGGNQAEPGGAVPWRAQALILLLSVGGLLGASIVIGKAAIGQGGEPLGVLMTAMALSGLVLTGLAIATGQGARPSWRLLEYGLVSGLLFAAPNAIGMLAVRHVGAGYVVLSFAFPILLTYVMALALNMEKMRTVKAVGVTFGLAAGVLLALGKAGGDGAVLFWVILVALAPVLIAVGNIYRTRRWPAGVAPSLLAGAMLLSGAAVLAPVVLFEGGAATSIVGSPAVWPLVLLQALVFSVLYLLYFLLQRLAGPVYLSQIGSVAAVVGVALSHLWLGEALPENLAVSGALLAIGLTLFQRGVR